MTPVELSHAIKEKLYPKPYTKDIQPAGKFDYLLLRNKIIPGARYAFAFLKIDSSDISEIVKSARSEARRKRPEVF